jgi:serine/threonine-protein kinase
MAEDHIGVHTGKTLGGYHLHELIGTGGAAEVYRGVDPTLDREVAIKVLRRELSQNEEFVRRFRAEAQRVASLVHPHVVPIYQFEEDAGYLLLIMPLLRGGSLRERLRRERRLASQEAVHIALQISMALEAAHTASLVHRDVKPENILFNAHGQALLTDFGLARDLPAGQQGRPRYNTAGNYGIPVGSPAYMAPEQFQPVVTLDQRVDIYALGVVLYEMLTGRVPFRGTPQQLAERAATRRCPPPSALLSSVWPDLDPRVMTALALLPDGRYQRASEFTAALQQSLDAHTHPPASASGQAVAEPLSHPPAIATGETDELPAIYSIPTLHEPVPREPWPLPLAVSSAGARISTRYWALLVLAAVVLLSAGGGLTLLLATGNGGTSPRSSGAGLPVASRTPSACPTPSPTPTATPTPPRTSTVTPTPSTMPSPTGGVVDLRGSIRSVDVGTNSFVFQEWSGTTYTVYVDAHTQFAGQATQLSDLQPGWRAEVQGSFQSDGSLLATLVNTHHGGG